MRPADPPPTTETWKPAGYPAVSPYLITDDAHAVIAFLAGALGGRVLRKFERENGSVVHAEVRIDDSVVMLGEAPGDSAPIPSHIHVYVPDVDRAYAAALEHGARSVQAPVRKDDPDRRGGVVGPGGNTWWLSTQTGEDAAAP